ncbi:hypothetical protein PENSPDRAFT_446877 [Peniophora sp. CONT]|nr:hypothetical protein PENSPDRAFT_446877 [Peniophora sp. CONT]
MTLLQRYLGPVGREATSFVAKLLRYPFATTGREPEIRDVIIHLTARPPRSHNIEQATEDPGVRARVAGGWAYIWLFPSHALL